MLNSLSASADIFARQIGCWRFNPSVAEADFRGYLTTVKDLDYPQWGARACWFDYLGRMQQQSGTGNPLSPLIVVGSEFSAEPDAYDELYFKYAFDLFWQEIFDCSPCPQVVARLNRDFLKWWGGAAKADKKLGYRHAPFYKSLRWQLQSDQSLLKSAPFVYKHMIYHTVRKGAHQWIAISRCLTFLRNWPMYKADNLSINLEPGSSFDGNFSRLTLDDYVFCTESRLEAAAAGGQNKQKKFNGFLSYALQEFKQPRIFLLNPAVKNGVYEMVYNELFPQVTTVLEWYIPAGSSKKPLRLWRHKNGHYLIFSPMNLTGAVSTNLLADIARLIRKAARKL